LRTAQPGRIFALVIGVAIVIALGLAPKALGQVPDSISSQATKPEQKTETENGAKKERAQLAGHA
jgi:hypothetical protein